MAIGKVTRPEYGNGDSKLVLTATLSRGGKSKTKKYSASVRQEGMTDTQIVAADKLDLEFPCDINNIISNVDLPTKGKHGSDVTWTTSKESVMNILGEVVRPVNGSNIELGKVTMTATLTRGVITDEKVFNCTVLPWSDEEEVAIDASNITWENIRLNNYSKTDVTSDLDLYTEGEKGSEISWISNSPGIVDIDGTVTRPSYIQGDVIATLSATVVKGTAKTTVNITGVRVIKKPMTNKEAVDKALDGLIISDLIGNNASIQEITTSFELPTTSKLSDCSSVRFAWTLCNENGDKLESHPNLTLTENNGIFHARVTRPKISENNGEVSIKCDGHSGVLAGSTGTGYKTIRLTILKLEAAN